MAKPIRYCLVPFCEKRRHSNGYCVNHFYAWKKHGDPTKLKQKQHHGLTLRERFDLYTKQGGPYCERLGSHCWQWIGHRDPNGYGRLNVEGVPVLAHRLSYLVRYGNI